MQNWVRAQGDGIPRVLFYFRLSVPRGPFLLKQWLLNELPNKRGALNKHKDRLLDSFRIDKVRRIEVRAKPIIPQTFLKASQGLIRLSIYLHRAGELP